MENNTPSFREQFVAAANELAAKDPDNEAINKPVERLNAADAQREKAEQRFEPKQEDRGETIRETITDAVEPAQGARQSYPVTDEDKVRPGYKVLSEDVRQSYSSWDSETRDYVDELARENEVLKTRSNYSKHLLEVDETLKPYSAKMKQFNVTPAQFIQVHAEVFKSLSNPQTRYQAFAQLATNHDIDLTRFSDPNFGQVMALEQQVFALQAEQQKALNDKAVGMVREWQKDKPHFNRMRKQIHDLCSSDQSYWGADGLPDITRAYEHLCEKANLDPYKKVEPIQPKQKQHKPAHQPRNQTIRDSIKAAVQEHR